MAELEDEVVVLAFVAEPRGVEPGAAAVDVAVTRHVVVVRIALHVVEREAGVEFARILVGKRLAAMRNELDSRRFAEAGVRAILSGGIFVRHRCIGRHDFGPRPVFIQSATVVGLVFFIAFIAVGIDFGFDVDRALIRREGPEGYVRFGADGRETKPVEAVLMHILLSRNGRLYSRRGCAPHHHELSQDRVSVGRQDALMAD